MLSAVVLLMREFQQELKESMLSLLCLKHGEDFVLHISHHKPFMRDTL